MGNQNAATDYEVVIPQQNAIAISIDRKYDLLHLKQLQWPDEDAVIVIQGQNVEEVILALQNAFDDLREVRASCRSESAPVQGPKK